MIMLNVYNLYLGGYLPKVSPKTNVHNKRELKTKYKNIVNMNNANPLVMVKMSNDTQAYALKVKGMSMELNEASQDVLEGKEKDNVDNLGRMSELFNELLKESDEFGIKNNRPSRPGGELRNLVERNAGELIEAGFSIDARGYLTAPTGEDGGVVRVPEKFVTELRDKCEHMSMNPMEYVEKKVYSYAHLSGHNVGNAYETSIFSGMLFNSYC